jgi:ferredoxin-type protein NapH
MRQQIRKAVIIFTFLSFPITMNFLSPYIVVRGASSGALSGSFLLFGFLFVSSLAAGRAWCGWACPVAGIQECMFLSRARRVRKGNWTKWLIWVPWVGLLAFAAIRAGGLTRLEPFLLTEGGISIREPWMFINYFLVIFVLLALSLAVGKRSFCHHLCWMAPFMIIGTRVEKALRIPSLRLRAEPGKCTKGCPMSLEVQAMVEKGNMFNDECILCGECVDGCPKGVIRYTFTRVYRGRP